MLHKPNMQAIPNKIKSMKLEIQVLLEKEKVEITLKELFIILKYIIEFWMKTKLMINIKKK